MNAFPHSSNPDNPDSSPSSQTSSQTLSQTLSQTSPQTLSMPFPESGRSDKVKDKAPRGLRSLGSALLVWLLTALALTGCSSSRPAPPSCCAQPHSIAADGAVSSSATPLSPTALTNEPDLFATPFLPPDSRPAVALDHRVTTHDGAVTTLRVLLDRPAAISFAYTRCANPNRCPRVVSTFGELREELDHAGLSEQVRLLLVSYDPAFDTPLVLRSYARLHSLRLDDRALFLQPEPDPEHLLFRDLGVRASFYETGVALHGIQLLLLDKHGRLARTYHTLLWDNRQVLADLQKLAGE